MLLLMTSIIYYQVILSPKEQGGEDDVFLVNKKNVNKKLLERMKNEVHNSPD